MIKTDITADSISMVGHAEDSAVCEVFTALTNTFFCAMQEACGMSPSCMELRTGAAKIIGIPDSHDAQLLTRSFVRGLELLAGVYPDSITIAK